MSKFGEVMPRNMASFFRTRCMFVHDMLQGYAVWKYCIRNYVSDSEAVLYRISCACFVSASKFDCMALDYSWYMTVL